MARSIALLSDAALKILRAQEGLRPVWVFPGPKAAKPLYAGAMLSILHKLDCINVTAHGFRSSFRVWVAERTTCSREIAEMALAHKQATAVEEAYQRSDLFERRRALMQSRAAWCSSSCLPWNPDREECLKTFQLTTEDRLL